MTLPVNVPAKERTFPERLFFGSALAIFLISLAGIAMIAWRDARSSSRARANHEAEVRWLHGRLRGRIVWMRLNLYNKGWVRRAIVCTDPKLLSSLSRILLLNAKPRPNMADPVGAADGSGIAILSNGIKLGFGLDLVRGQDTFFVNIDAYGGPTVACPFSPLKLDTPLFRKLVRILLDTRDSRFHLLGPDFYPPP